MSILYIIGNGFDSAHELPTKYSDFREFLINEYNADEDIDLFLPEISMGSDGEEDPDSTEVASLVARLLLNSNVEDDWSDFEEKLGQLDYDEFYDQIENFGSDDEENPWITAYKMEDASSILLNAVPYIKELFREWITTIPVRQCRLQKEPFRIWCMQESATFLNFNYTLTLEMLYGIKKVCHIHGKKGESILVGHGDDSDIAGCFDNTGFPGAICNLTNVKRALRKNTNKALMDNQGFFNSLSDVNKIYSIGFSYSSVDLIYIEEICKQINSIAAVWIFNDYVNDKPKIPYFKDAIRRCGFKGRFEIEKII